MESPAKLGGIYVSNAGGKGISPLKIGALGVGSFQK